MRRGDLCDFVCEEEEKFSCNWQCQWEMSPIDSISESESLGCYCLLRRANACRA
jgi:hypothetical protein